MKTILVDAVDTFVVDGVVQEEMYMLLEKYPNRKIIVTNADDSQLEGFGLVDLPYEMFSLKHNPDKVDPVFFKKLLAQYELSAEDVVYFEHSPKAVESARSVGITAYFYDATKRDLKALKQFLDENA